jgi:uncharacterized protein YsxB (DUF464 family)
MTEVRLEITREDGPLWFDCIGHAGDREVCGMISTLLNFLVVYMAGEGKCPSIYEPGHLQFEEYMSNKRINDVFKAVVTTLSELSVHYPDNLKIINF